MAWVNTSDLTNKRQILNRVLRPSIWPGKLIEGFEVHCLCETGDCVDDNIFKCKTWYSLYSFQEHWSAWLARESWIHPSRGNPTPVSFRAVDISSVLLYVLCALMSRLMVNPDPVYRASTLVVFLTSFWICKVAVEGWFNIKGYVAAGIDGTCVHSEQAR